MTFEDGAAIPVNYLTAYHSMFTMGNLQPGDRILIHGAAGGVGIAAVQLARARGLVTFGTAGPSKQEFLRKIGVDHAIDYEKSDFVAVVRKFAPDGIEMVMDAIGGKSFARSASMPRPDGTSGGLRLFGCGGSRRQEELVARRARRCWRRRDFIPCKLMSEKHRRDRRESGKIAIARRRTARPNWTRFSACTPPGKSSR